VDNEEVRMTIRSTRKFESGVTLVDVVMAVALLGIMAAGVLGSFRYGLFVMQLVRENQRATQIMLEKVETVRLYSWGQVNSNGFIPSSFTDDYDPQAPTSNRGVTYYGTVVGPTNVPFSCTYSTNMRQITVSLRWTTRNIPHTRSVTTYIAKDGIQNYVY
jgi:type II secretory pathway pseudopilin PulG